MFSLFREVTSILKTKDKVNLYKIIFLKFFLGILEALSVLTFVPFFYILTDKDFISSNKFISEINNFFYWSSSQLTLTFLLLPLGTIIVLNFYRLFVSWIETKLINNLWFSFHSNLFNYYLSKPYLYHVENDSNYLLSKFMIRANDALTGTIIPIYFLIGSILTSLVLIFMIFIYNPIVSSILIIFILIFYLTLFQLLKKKS